LNQNGAGIPYPYKVPNKTLPDGTPGVWTLIGATEAVQEELADEDNGKGKNKKIISCGDRREDEK